VDGFRKPEEEAYVLNKETSQTTITFTTTASIFTFAASTAASFTATTNFYYNWLL